MLIKGSPADGDTRRDFQHEKEHHYKLGAAWSLHLHLLPCTDEASDILFETHHTRKYVDQAFLTQSDGSVRLQQNKTLKQLPFLGKQTVPTHFRKDFWKPMATVAFPNGHQGLEAYRQLREFRKRHEHEWTPAEVGARVIVDGKYGVDLKKAAKGVQNQKANTVADLAFVLGEQKRLADESKENGLRVQNEIDSAITNARESLPRIKQEMQAAKTEARNGDEKALKLYRSLKRQKMRIPRALAQPRPDKALARKYDPHNDRSAMPRRGPRRRLRLATQVPKFSTEGVRVVWTDVHDAEFAADWPENVVHDTLEYTRNVPPPGRLSIREPRSKSKKPALPVKTSEVGDNEVAKAKKIADAPAARPPTKPTMMQRLLVRLRDGA